MPKDEDEKETYFPILRVVVMLCFAAAVPPRGADATMIDTAGLLTYLYVPRLPE